MSKPLYFEIFRSGTHTDSKGNESTWTQEDVKKIVSQYNESDHEAPIVCGHPKGNGPAHGWIDSLELKGSSIFATAKDVVPEFAEALKKKMFKKRSSSFYPDLTLRHVGFLGDTPPAIKGLEDFAFSDDGEKCSEMAFDFTDIQEASLFNSIGRTLGRLRDTLIDKFDLETANNAIPNYLIDDLKEVTPNENDENLNNTNSLFSEKTQEGAFAMTEAEIKAMKAENERLTASNSDFAEQNKSLTTEKETAETKLKEFEDGKIADEKKKTESFVSDFCDQLVSDGKLKPTDKGVVSATLLALKDSEDTKVEFGEGDDKKEISAFEAYKNQLIKADKVVDFSEVAKKDDASHKPANFAEGESRFKDSNLDDESTDQYNSAKKIMSEFSEQGKSITFKDALAKVRTAS